MSEKLPIDYYFYVVGLEPGATLEELKEAHKFLVQTFHEDKYPPGRMQDKAKEKMIQTNEAYDKLTKFFEDNPDGMPEGGWKTGPFRQETNSANAGEMDWQTWQSHQAANDGSEVKRWQEEENARRDFLKLDEGRQQRRIIANWSRVALWMSLIFMWGGHSCTGVEHQIGDGTSVNYMAANLDYKKRMGIVTQHDYDLLKTEKAKWNKDADQNNGSMIFLYVFLGGMLYLTFARRPKDYVLDWIDTGELKNPLAQEATA